MSRRFYNGRFYNATGSSYTSISQELSIGETQELFLRAHTAPVRNEDLKEISERQRRFRRSR